MIKPPATTNTHGWRCQPFALSDDSVLLFMFSGGGWFLSGGLLRSIRKASRFPFKRIRGRLALHGGMSLSDAVAKQRLGLRVGASGTLISACCTRLHLSLGDQLAGSVLGESTITQPS